jgi:hypothetical protein
MLAIASLALANLPGSTFESSDGNLLVNSAGDEDWANVGIVCPTGPGSGTGCGIDEPTGTSDNSFGQGAKEDDPAVTIVTGSIPPNKNDLTRFYEFSETKNVGMVAHTFLYLGWERLLNTGAANLDFEINQNPTPGFTASTLGNITLTRTVGDLLITYDFGGSGAPSLGGLTWETAATPVPPYWAPNTQNICFSTNKPPTSAGCWADRLDLSAIGVAEGAVNTAPVCDPIPLGSGSPVCTSDASGNLTAGLFGEAGVDLTAANIISPSACENFGSVFVKSRSSPSFTAEVKDFIAPVAIRIANCTSAMTTQPSVGSNASVTPGTAVTDSATVTVTANGSPATGPLGTVSFYVCGPTSAATVCTVASGTSLGTKTLSGNSPATVTSDSTSPTKGGFYCFLAVYNPANSFPGASDSDTATECFRVKASPSISTTLSAATGNIGDTIRDSATLTGATSDAGGTVTYTVYSDSTCTTSFADAGTKTVTNAVVPDSNGVQFNQAGTFYWQASYSGDTNNLAAKSVCTTESLVIGPNKPGITTQLSETTGSIGNTVTDSATLNGATGNAGGSVTYTVYTDNTCATMFAAAGTVTVTNGVVPSSNGVQFNQAGTFFWQASYTGDANNQAAKSDCASEMLIINKNAPGATTAESLIPDDSATLSGGFNPTGSITLSLFAPSDATCSGTAAFSQTLTVNGNATYSTTNRSQANPFVASTNGVWRWQVSYTGDSNNSGFTSACGIESFTITE